MIWVTKAAYLKDYKISVTFNNGKKGIIDLKHVIVDDNRTIFQSLKDMSEFKKFTVDMDTIVWRNGLDLAPEFLYGLCKASSRNSRRCAA